MKDILTKIIEQRKKNIARLGLNFGCSIPEKRERPIHPFMAEKGLVLEVKRASPSKGDIAPKLDSYKTAFSYASSGAKAISCLTETNYFKGTLNDLMSVCRAIDDFEKESSLPPPAVLRKDFLLSAKEIEISYRAGADAVLLIARILEKETFLQMAKKVSELGLYALVEVRSEEDLAKLDYVMSRVEKSHFVCGVNSRDLATFKIDLLKPLMMKEKISAIMGEDSRIIFESGVTTEECARAVGSMGFYGILLGEAAAKNPEMAKKFVRAFESARPTKNARFWAEYASSLLNLPPKSLPLIKICGLTRKEDALLAESLGSSFLGFIFSDTFPRSLSHENRLEALLPELPSLKAKKICVITETESETAQKAVSLVKEGVFDLLQFHKIPYEKIALENAGLLELPHYFAVGSMEEAETIKQKGELRVLQDSRKCSETTPLQEKGEIGECGNDCGGWLAGGITPENIGKIIRGFSPELIDISSGIEDEGKIGIKNEEKMKALFSFR